MKVKYSHTLPNLQQCCLAGHGLRPWPRGAAPGARGWRKRSSPRRPPAPSRASPAARGPGRNGGACSVREDVFSAQEKNMFRSERCALTRFVSAGHGAGTRARPLPMLLVVMALTALACASVRLFKNGRAQARSRYGGLFRPADAGGVARSPRYM